MKKIVLAFLCLSLVVPALVQAASFNQVAAVVNGQMISLFDVQNAAKPDLARAKIDPQNAAQQPAVRQLYTKVLEGMILDILLAEEAKKQKITVTPAEVDAEIAKVMQQRRLPKADFEKQLRNEGLTPEGLRDRVQKTILRQKIMGMMVGRKVVVTPEEVKAYYEENKEKMRAGGTLRMALLIYPPNVDAAGFAKRIKAGSVSFEDVVRQVSIGPNKPGGGDVGPVQIERLNPQWKEKLSAMRPGDVSSVFVVDGKKAQLKLLQSPSGGGHMSLSEATPYIENILREPRLQERFVEYTDQLRKKAVIDIRL